MQLYKSKCNRIAGTSHADVISVARYEYHKIQKQTPRREAYVRSKYFKLNKVFINQFWAHLKQKHPNDQLRRAKLFLCAIDLLRNSTFAPDTIFSSDNKNILLHRFYGVSSDGHSFCVQVRQNKRTDRKDFMSVYPIRKSNK